MDGEPIFEVTTIPFRELPLSNDFLFGEVMRKPEICRLFLEALLGKPIARVEYVLKQKDISDSYWSRGIRLDVYLNDEEGAVYNIEMEARATTVLPKRSRYYQGTIDRHHLGRGEWYATLPDSYIIFVCAFDPFKRGLALYKRKMLIEGYQNPEKDIKVEDFEYQDGSHLYYLNSAYETENADAAILEFLRCIRSNNINAEDYATPLMKAVCPAIDEIRHDSQKEAEYMTLQMKMMEIREEGREEGEAKGKAEGKVEGKAEVVMEMLRDNAPLSLIEKYTQVSAEKIAEIARSIGVSPVT